MLVATAEQNADLKQASQPDDDQTIVVEAQSDELIALLRIFAPTASARRNAARILEQAGCALPDRRREFDLRRIARSWWNFAASRGASDRSPSGFGGRSWYSMRGRRERSRSHPCDRRHFCRA